MVVVRASWSGCGLQPAHLQGGIWALGATAVHTYGEGRMGMSPGLVPQGHWLSWDIKARLGGREGVSKGSQSLCPLFVSPVIFHLKGCGAWGGHGRGKSGHVVALTSVPATCSMVGSGLPRWGLPSTWMDSGAGSQHVNSTG